MRTKLTPEPPDDERMNLTPEELAQLNNELRKFGRGVFFKPASPTPEEIEAAKPVESKEEPAEELTEKWREEVQREHLMSAQNVVVMTNKVTKAKTDDPSYAATLGLRLGDFVASTWRGAYGEEAKPPKDVVATAIAVYIAQHRGEGMG